jgi:5-methyltetrahydropteroyltriglutamate--homocysteine methyltransferase
MINTTVVGSYPVPLWLRVVSNAESLRDAMMAVLKTQELAGIDVVADGELYRWDVNHADTNGMIDYFVRPMGGIRVRLTAEELARWRSRPGMGYRAQPAGVVTEALTAGELDLPRDYERYRALTERPKKFTVTSPYMLAKVLSDEHYRDFAALVMALADVLAAQVA